MADKNFKVKNGIEVNDDAVIGGNIAVTGTVDGRDIAADGTKLDGIEAGATADQTKADIDALGIDAATLDGLDSTDLQRVYPDLGGITDLDLAPNGWIQGDSGDITANKPPVSVDRPFIMLTTEDSSGDKYQLFFISDYIYRRIYRASTPVWLSWGVNNSFTQADKEKLDSFGLGDWVYLVQKWDTPPTLNTNISSGAVYNYTLGGVTRYRLVPEPYQAVKDEFFTSFDGTTLSGLVAARGE